MEIVVNGQDVLNVDLGHWTEAGRNPDGTTNPRKTALRDLKREGHIALQFHNGSIQVRNIRVKSLSGAGTVAPPPQAAGFVPLFNGKDLTRWSGWPGLWRIEGGAVIGRLPAGRDKPTFLCSQQAYKDFELRFRVRLKNGVGNSGVQVRSKLTDAVDYIVAGPQVEVDAVKFGGCSASGWAGGG